MKIRRAKLDASILEELKFRIYNYFNLKDYTNKEQVNEMLWRMDEKKSLEVENLVEQAIGRMVNRSRSPVISIDEYFCEFEEAKPVGFKSIMDKLIKSQLVHELMHSASRSSRSGIRKLYKVRSESIDTSEDLGEIINYYKKYDNFDRFVGLDEGITQMMTEKVNGFIVSPQTDSYNDLKKYAKILDVTFGEETMFSSYFFKTGTLEKACNQMARNDQFWQEFNKMLDNIFNAECESRDLTINEYDRQVYRHFTKEIQPSTIAYFTANIIIPKLKQLSESSKRTYLDNIFNSIRDDNEFSLTLAKSIIKMYKMNSSELDKAKEDALRETKISTSLINSFSRSIFSKELDEELLSIYDKYIAVMTDKTFKKRYSMPKDCFLEEAFFSYKYIIDKYKEIYIWNKKLYPSLTEEDIKEMAIDESKVYNGLDAGLQKGVIYRFNSNDSIIDRKAALARLKFEARNRGYLILNALSECENSNSFVLDFIEISRDGKKINFDDMKLISNRYGFEVKEDEEGLGGEKHVIDKTTGRKIDDPVIEELTEFAELWKANGYTFNDDNKKFYDEFSDLIARNLNEKGSVDVEEFYRVFSIPRTKIEELLATNENIRIIDTFYRLSNKGVMSEAELPMTSYELVNGKKKETYYAETVYREITGRITPKSIIDASKQYVQEHPGKLSTGVSRFMSTIKRNIELDINKDTIK